MKIILSRKGFDSSSGGVPNPILPDGSLLPLPIPDQQSCVCYDDLANDKLKAMDTSYASIINDLTKGRLQGRDGAHLDPDVCAEHYPRDSKWLPVFGQRGSALGHLKKQGVGVSDIFLFFGVFRPVEQVEGVWRFVAKTSPQHILWGWMQVGQVIQACDAIGEYPWVSYHPHCQRGADQSDLLYFAAARVDSLGAGAFETVTSDHWLSDPERSQPSAWRLPIWFYPDARAPLSFHSKSERWAKTEEFCLLQSVARGQEFVLDAEQYPQALSWVRSLIAAGMEA